MKIISPRTRHNEVYYRLHFDFENEPGNGFAFDCDKDGNVDEDKLKIEKPVAWNSLQACKTGQITVWEQENLKKNKKIFLKGVQEYSHNWVSPAVGECNHCQEKVPLHGFTNTCTKCGTDYNSSGQELAPRSQWGEETGESVSDILSVDCSSNEELFEG